MTAIVELEFCIRSTQTVIKRAEATLERLNAELTELKAQAQEQQEPESLFGRWATHPERGRGIIVSIKPDGDGELRFAYLNSSYTDGVNTRFVRPEYLDLDPLTLITVEDYRDAPDGTIVEAATEPHDVYVKTGKRWWVAGELAATDPTHMPTCRVIRWGNGK
ncbi:hypothetical protein [Corynebacterium sp. 5QC2CO]|uniref:hypothetical protein n=1 Tax=Corynebacterium sp. 5QC2CO TaxID=2968468 RepID=UPI00211CF0E5|nr:hypothetical protein [Corynebacterium sp. 5QC2CO]MCQ9349375.1 hypothetical protein [Corynebacterium sp. 5QC2CO]